MKFLAVRSITSVRHKNFIEAGVAEVHDIKGYCHEGLCGELQRATCHPLQGRLFMCLSCCFELVNLSLPLGKFTCREIKWVEEKSDNCICNVIWSTGLLD
jgi:hypothetical protein